MAPRVTLTLALALSAALWAAPSPVAASFLTFTGPPAGSGAVTMFANGNLSGATPIDRLGPLAGQPGASHVITGGGIAINPARATAGSPTAGYYFDYGGSFEIVGSLDGGPGGTLVTCTRLLDGGHIDYLGPTPGGPAGSGHYRLDTGFVAVMSDGLAATLGYRSPGPIPAFIGEIVLTFDVTPGDLNGSLAGATTEIRMDLAGVGVPEPGSAGMVAAGVALGWASVRGRRRTGRRAA